MSELPDGARAVVVTASNRAAAGVYEDRSGQMLAAGLRELGFAVDDPLVLPDDVDALDAVSATAVADGVDVVLTTGGTGLSPTDVTPEATRAVLDREAPGIAEAVRRYGAEQAAHGGAVPGLAGVAGRTLIVNLPGSTGGARDGLAVLGPLLPHAVSQLRGGDHVDARASDRSRPPASLAGAPRPTRDEALRRPPRARGASGSPTPGAPLGSCPGSDRPAAQPARCPCRRCSRRRAGSR